MRWNTLDLESQLTVDVGRIQLELLVLLDGMTITSWRAASNGK